MKLGILSCGHVAPEVKNHGDFSDMFKKLLTAGEYEFFDYDIENMEFPKDVADCDAWLLTGSKHGVYEDHAFIAPLEEFVRQAYEAKIPMVGICFGHQLIAQALGGKVEKSEKGWGLGVNEYEFSGTGPLRLNAWHQDQIISPPVQARVVASNDFCKYAALAYGETIFTTQPHPEFQSDFVADYAGLRRGTADYPDAVMDRLQNGCDAPHDGDKIAKYIIEFLEKRCGSDHTG